MPHVRRLPLSRYALIVIALSALLSLILTPAAQAATPYTWTPTDSLNVARPQHTATLLSDGRVLVAGGGNTSYLASAELYDPASGAWSFTGSLNAARTVHTATLLLDGRVLVAGGSNGSALASAELYDPATGSWTLAGSLNVARCRHTATLLSDGRVLVAGGWDGSSALASAELYDPASGAWTLTTGSLNVARRYHTATLLPDGRVLVAGGYDNNSLSLSSAELYNPATGSWALTGSLNAARNQHTATLLPDGRVLAVGGHASTTLSAELFNPATGSWAATGSLATGRRHHSATLLPDGRVLVVGGYGASGQLASAELYDPATGTWSYTGALSHARGYHTATLLAGGRVLVAGGFDYNDMATCELYETLNGQWTLVGSLGHARAFHKAVLLPDGRVLVAGGADGSGARLASALLYNPATNVWTAIDPMNQPRIHHTMTLLPDGRVLVAGGQHDTGYHSSAEIFDPATGLWSYTGSLRGERTYHTATLLPDGRVLVCGGIGLGALGNGEIYDDHTGTWSDTASLSGVRVGQTATLLKDGRVLVVGGDNGAALSGAWLYDPATGLAAPTGSLNTGRAYHAATLLPDGRVLVTAGFNGSPAGHLASAELYNPATGSWSYTGSLGQPRMFPSATLLPDGRVLVVEGVTDTNLYSAEVYDPAVGNWTFTPDLTDSRDNHSATLLPDGRVLVVGSWGGITATVETFDRGLGYLPPWQPVIGSATSPLLPGTSLALSGSGYRGYGYTEASGGGANNSASNIPVVQIMRLDNEQVIRLLPDPAQPFTATAFTSAPILGFPSGHALVTVFVNGIPSGSALTMLAAPDLSITKVVQPAIAYPGETITFGLSFANSGTYTATNLLITDTLPAGVSYLSTTAIRPVTISGPLVSGQEIVWSLPSLGPGSDGAIIFTAQIACQAGEVLTNTAAIANSSGDVDTANNVAIAVPLVQPLGLDLNLSAGACDLTVNATAHYTGPVPVNFLFTWGDGATSSGASSSALLSASHTYASCGVKSVTLQLTTAGGCTISRTEQIAVNQPPTISYLNIAQPNACADVVTYTATVADCGGLDGLTWRLGFFDGGVYTGTGGTIMGSHTLVNPASCGSLTATLIVTDTSGCTARRTDFVNLNQPPTINSVTIAQPSACADVVRFAATVADCDGLSMLSWRVNFPDGGRYTGTGGTISGNHTLLDPEYCEPITATLTITDSAGCVVSGSSNVADLNQPVMITGVVVAQPNACADVITFTAAVADCDGLGALTWRISLSDGGVYTGTGATISGSHTLFDPAYCGPITATVVVTDEYGCVVTRASSAADINQPPEMAETTLYDANPVDDVANYRIRADDCDGGTIVYSLFLDGPGAIIPNRIVVAPAGMAIDSLWQVSAWGNYTLTVTARDALGCASVMTNTAYIGPTEPYLEKRIWYRAVCAGWSQRYDLDVTNTTTSTMSGLLLRDFLPPGTRFGDTNDANGHTTGGVFDPIRREVRWNIGDVPPGGHVRVNLTVYVNSTMPVGSIITNRARLESALGLFPEVSESFTLIACPAPATPTATRTPTPTPVCTGEPPAALPAPLYHRAQPSASGRVLRLDLNQTLVDDQQSVSVLVGGTITGTIEWQAWGANNAEPGQIWLLRSWDILPLSAPEVVLFDGLLGVAPGQQVTQTFTMTAPTQPGKYYLWVEQENAPGADRITLKEWPPECGAVGVIDVITPPLRARPTPTRTPKPK